MEQTKRAPQEDSPDLGLVSDLFYHEYDILNRLTAKMLVTKNIDDKLSLILDAVTSELGYPHSAFGLIDPDSDQIKIRMALGFPDDEGVSGMTVSSSIGSPVGSVSTLGGRPVWIRRSNGSAEKQFLDSIRSSSDLLAVPLFAGRRV